MNRDESIKSPTRESIQIHAPAPEDAAAIWELVQGTPALDGNSPYAYLLLCTHFANTGVVARIGRQLVGFVLGYSRPDKGGTAFVWQVAVAEKARGRGLGAHLLDAWFARCACGSNAQFLEATVTPSNKPSRALFASFAKRHGVRIHERVAFPQDLFPDAAPHEEEIAIRIGPVPLARAIPFPKKEIS
jgi:L-2,4-diaminobutyric acid acetyltransferase